MRVSFLPTFLIPLAILAVESLTLGQPDTSLGLGLVLTLFAGVFLWGAASALRRSGPREST